MQLWLWLAAILMFVNLLVELEIPLIATQWLVLEVTEEYQGVVYLYVCMCGEEDQFL